MEKNDQLPEVFQNLIRENFEAEDPVQTPSEKMRTSLRLQYEAEARVLHRQMGGIEAVRKELGLSRRKICQLLLVDPSTWTRWTRDESKVPPHIFKALQWYLVSLEKYPMIHPLHQVSIVKEGFEMEKEQLIQERLKLERKIRELEGQIHSQQTKVEYVSGSEVSEKVEIGLGWKMLLLFNTILILFFFARLL